MKSTARLIALIALPACISLAARAETEIKGTPTELAAYLNGVPQMVSITGESEIKVPADKAEVTIKVTTENRLLSDALRLNQEARGRVVAFLKESGFTTNQIQGAKFSSTPKSGWFSEKAKSHRVDNFLKITVRDEKDFQAVGLTVDKWPEVQFLGIDVQHSDKEGMKAKAQAEALAKAGERRKLYEQTLGVKLVAKRFQETLNASATPEAPQVYGGVAYSSIRYDKTTSIPGRERETEDVSSPFGEMTFTARVVVEYAVESK